jgi:hypothetical protein
MQAPTERLQLPSLTPIQFLLEIAIIVIAAIIVTHPYDNMNPLTHVAGADAEDNMSGGYTVAKTLHDEGYIPLWQPLLGQGDATLNAPSSNYLFVPFIGLPTLFMGPNNGVKIGIILLVIITGLGGWVLARMIGLHGLARVALGLFCIGRGNLHSVMSIGDFQLGMCQTLFPWILAGAMGIFWYKHRRWPIVLLALSIVLMFWIGWVYIVDFLIMMGLLTLIYLVRPVRVETGDGQITWRSTIDWAALRRMTLAAVLTVVLASATLIPLMIQHNNWGASSITQDDVNDVGLILKEYFYGVPTSDLGGFGFAAYFYNFVSPFWFVGFAICAALLAAVVYPRIRRYYPRTLWRLLIVIVFAFGYFTLWGAGQNPIVPIMYRWFPLTAQMRHVERQLAMGAFLIAVMLAICIDAAWVSFVLAPIWNQGRVARVGRFLNVAAALILLIPTGMATGEALSFWNVFNTDALDTEQADLTPCLQWMRDQNGNQVVDVWVLNYWSMTPFLRYNIRFSHVVLDGYKPSAGPSTYLPNGDLTAVLPKYSQTTGDQGYGWEDLNGYDHPVPGAPTYEGGRACFLQRAVEPFSYVFSVPTDVLATKTTLNGDYVNKPINRTILSNQLFPSDTQPITTFNRHNDYIGILVDSDPKHDLVVTAGEVAYPGWSVSVNNHPAKLETVGGQIGVVVPKGTGTNQILFLYRPGFVIVSWLLTLFGAILCVAYLLRLDRFIPIGWYVRSLQTGQKMLHFLFNPNVMGTDEIIEDIAKPQFPLLADPSQKARSESDTETLNAVEKADRSDQPADEADIVLDDDV